MINGHEGLHARASAQRIDAIWRPPSDGAPHSGTIAGPATATKQGPAVLRRLLVQIAWGMKRRSARVSALFERLTHGQRTRRKKAIVAVARKILI